MNTKALIWIIVVLIVLVLLALGGLYISDLSGGDGDIDTFEFGEEVSEATQNPTEDLPETNPFGTETNPFGDYNNPFE